MTTFIAFFVVLSILIFVHELGHYTVAKLSGIGVERFSIGMPPEVFGVTIGETRYCISAIPFGGYVKLTGQSDFDEVPEEEMGPKDYRAKSAPVKMALLGAGSFMNLVTALVIFFFVYWTTGVPEATMTVDTVEQGSLAAETGLRPGDTVVAMNGDEVERLEDVLMAIYTSDGVELTVTNSDGARTLNVPRRLEDQEDFGVQPWYRAEVGSVVVGEPADQAGIVPGDVILAVGGEEVAGWESMRRVIQDNPDRTLPFTIERDGETLTMDVTIGHTTVDMPDGGKKTIGRVGYTPEIPQRVVGPVEAASMAWENTVFLVTHTLDFFFKLVTGRMSAKLLGGPVMIAQLAGESAKSGIMSLLGFTAFISVNLGVLNLLPFPALDGGHIFFLLIETVTRRKMSHRVRMAFQQIGTFALLALMLYITFNDVMRIDTISRFFGGN